MFKKSVHSIANGAVSIKRVDVRAHRIAAIGAICLVGACVILALAGCSDDAKSDNGNEGFSPVRIGTMPTEDFLPMWAAEKDGDFAKAGVDVELLTFDSAQALSAAIAAGEVDMAMVDIPRAVKLCESGTPVIMEWVTLGTEASQGAFGVMAAADAPYSTLKELAEYMATHDDKWTQSGVGLAANTVPEYVFEMLCAQQGVAPSEIKTQEIASLPERYTLMASGNLAAAALPGSLLRLGEATGMKLLAEDTEGDNISQSVMIATEAFANDNSSKIESVAKAWDMASESINAHPDAYIELLAQKANLNETISQTYPISQYPMALEGDALLHPQASLVDPQIEWMRTKGYISSDVSYDQSNGAISIG